MNKILVVANLVANPEYRITEKEKKVCRMRIAINSIKETCFINLVVFDNLADQCQTYLQKGSRIFAEGRLTMTQKENVTYYDIIGDSVQFIKNLKVVDKKEDKNNDQ